MTIEHLGPGQTPSWAGVLPGEPQPFFLDAGDGERSQMFDALVTVLVSADETGGQFGVFTVEQPADPTIAAHTHPTVHEIFYRLLRPGDFGYVPAGVLHAYRAEGEYNKVLGVSTGGFERFFQALGTLTEARGAPGAFFMPSPEQMGQAFAAYDNIPRLNQQWTE